MKYLKYFEKIKGKNVKIGEIYRIRPVQIDSHKTTIPLAKIIKKLGPEIVNLETYIEDENCEKWTLGNYNKRILLNIATKEEIEYFNDIANMFAAIKDSKKYNL